MRELLNRLWDWLHRGRLDRELQEELRFHAAQLESEARAAGEPAEAAAVRARRQLGNTTRIREDARDRWAWPWLDRRFQDLRHAIRGLRRTPGFTVTVALTLGLGIGANAAMFGVVDQLMFRPFPMLRAPSEVHAVYLRYTYRGETHTNATGLEYARYRDLARWSTTIAQAAAVSERRMAVGRGEESRERLVSAVSGTFFDFFDLTPVAGRFFGPAEDVPGQGARVVVLGHDFWANELGGRDVVGSTLRVHDMDCAVIGVAPRGFAGVREGSPPDLYLPITTYADARLSTRGLSDYATHYNWGWLSIMVRRKPGISAAEASADLTGAYVRSWNAERELSPGTPPAEAANPTAIAGPLKVAAGPSAGLESKTLLWVTGVAAIVLLIACANVTNIMLARSLSRRRETAVRLALGVSRRRLLGQRLTESLLLGLLGCGVGIAVAQWGGAVVHRLFPDAAAAGGTDWRTLGVALGIAVLAGVATGLGSAATTAGGSLTDGLKSGPRSGGAVRSRTRAGLLVAQAALSVVLLVGAGLFVRSLEHARSLRLGFDPDGVLMAVPNLRGAELSEDRRRQLGDRLLEAARVMPGVDHVALVSSVPFWSTSTTAFFVPGIDSVRRLGRFTYQTGSPDYFAAMGTRVLQGRGFSPDDRAAAPRVAVVSEAMASLLWPGQDAVGQCMRVGADTMPCTRVVGVAENAYQDNLTDDPLLRWYMPMEQYADRAEALLLRMRGEAGAQIEAVRAALQREMPGDGYVTVESLQGMVDRERRSWQLGATMFLAFGALALIVAAVGLYGVITYNVAQRMHELGIRTALGARAGDLARLVVRQGMRFAVIGAAIGVAIALYAGRWIEPLLFQQRAADPVTFGVVVGVLLLVALVATAVPAARATRADPNVALRSD